MKRTPAPWRARLVHSQMDDPGTTVAVAGPKLPDGRQWMLFADADRGDPEADAKLMAAAPMLLEAVLVADDVIDSTLIKAEPHLQEVRDVIRAAIAAARGEL